MIGLEKRIEKWIKKNWGLSIYILLLLFVVIYYVICYSQIIQDLYIIPCVNTFVNILMFILFMIVPFIWFAREFWKIKINEGIKIFSFFMIFGLMSMISLLAIFMLNVFNPMTFSLGEMVNYDKEAGLYQAKWCSLDMDCGIVYYEPKFIFAKRVG